jgi:hypothetical protein
VEGLGDQRLARLDVESLRKLELPQYRLGSVTGTTTNKEAASDLDLQYEAPHHNILGYVIPVFDVNEAI